METIQSIKPLIAVLVSICVVPLLVLSKRPNMRETWTFAAAIVKLPLVLSMLPAILAGNQIVYTLAQVVPGVAIRFRVDALGMLFACVAASLWIVTSAYSMGYMRGLDEHSQTRYFVFFCPGPFRHHRCGLFRQSADPLSFLRNVVIGHLPAGNASPGP